MKDSITDRTAELMVKVVDGVASPAEREELMALAVADPALRAELDAQRSVKAVTDGWMGRLQADLAADRDRTDPVRRGERGIGVTLMIAGLAILGGWGPVELLLDPAAPAWLRLGTALSGAGTLLVLFHLVRTRFLSGERDPYDEVIR